MFHATCTLGNQGDSRFLVVRNQIANLTPNLSFRHNLCFKCPNGSCKTILDIYIPRDFQWYKDFFNPMGFDPYNVFLKIWESIATPILKVGAHLGVWRFISFTLSYTLGSMRCDSRASLLAFTLASVYLGHEPKARVATRSHSHWTAMAFKRLGTCGTLNVNNPFFNSLWIANTIATNCPMVMFIFCDATSSPINRDKRL